MTFSFAPKFDFCKKKLEKNCNLGKYNFLKIFHATIHNDNNESNNK